MSIPIGYPYTFFLLFIRILAFVGTAPLFSQRTVPNQVKIGLAGLCAFVLTPVARNVYLPDSDLVFLAVLVQEILIGLLLGFTTMLPIWTIGLVGRLIASAMGMSYATTVSPLFPESTPPLGQFYLQLALLFFLMVQGDHVVLMGMKRMVDLMPPGRLLSDVMAQSGEILVGRMIFFTSQMWSVALQLALPVMGVVLLADISLVLISRAMPRMNVFSQSLPLKVAMGLISILLTFPYFWPQIVEEVNQTGHQMLLLFR